MTRTCEPASNDFMSSKSPKITPDRPSRKLQIQAKDRRNNIPVCSPTLKRQYAKRDSVTPTMLNMDWDTIGGDCNKNLPRSSFEENTTAEHTKILDVTTKPPPPKNTLQLPATTRAQSINFACSQADEYMHRKNVINSIVVPAQPSSVIAANDHPADLSSFLQRCVIGTGQSETARSFASIKSSIRQLGMDLEPSISSGNIESEQKPT